MEKVRAGPVAFLDRLIVLITVPIRTLSAMPRRTIKDERTMPKAVAHRWLFVPSKAIAPPLKRSNRRPRPRQLRPVEVLEGRELLSTFTVTNLQRLPGPGRCARRSSRPTSNPGPDTIDFGVAGTIRVGRTVAPRDHRSRHDRRHLGPGVRRLTGRHRELPGYPRAHVRRRFGRLDPQVARAGEGRQRGRHARRLERHGPGQRHRRAGQRLKTVAGNRGDGIRIDASSHGDLIGQLDPVTGVTYYNSDSVSMQPVSGWQGIRDAGTPGQYLITGTSGDNGLLYIGPISGAGGTSYSVNDPGAYVHERLRPRPRRPRCTGNVLRLVGSYTTSGGSTSTGSSSRGRPPISRIPRLPDDRLSRRDVHLPPQHDGRPRVGNAGDIAASTDHAFLYSISQAQDPDRHRLSGL